MIKGAPELLTYGFGVVMAWGLSETNLNTYLAIGIVLILSLIVYTLLKKEQEIEERNEVLKLRKSRKSY